MLDTMDYEEGIKAEKKLEEFYNKVASLKATETDRKEILILLNKLINTVTNDIAEKKKRREVDEFQTFNLGFAEFVKEIKIIVERLNLKILKFNMKKLRIMMDEFKLMLNYQEKPTLLTRIKNIRKEEIVQLCAKTLKPVLLTFLIALPLNILIKNSSYGVLFEPIISNLLAIETGMAALIVFITSFNLGYTNTKRGNTDLALIEFTNMLNIYARRIKFTLKLTEKDKEKRKKIYEDVNYFFNCIGMKIIEGVDKKNSYNLKFDITILQCFDSINDLVEKHVEKLDSVTRVRFRTVQDELIEAMNKFQIIATIRTSKIFVSMNSWLIRITYFVLAVIAPFTALPRLFIINFMQRAFFNVARETDNAIYNCSIAKLPVENRIVRRLCRISSILNEK